MGYMKAKFRIYCKLFFQYICSRKQKKKKKFPTILPEILMKNFMDVDSSPATDLAQFKKRCFLEL